MLREVKRTRTRRIASPFCFVSDTAVARKLETNLTMLLEILLKVVLCNMHVVLLPPDCEGLLGKKLARVSCFYDLMAIAQKIVGENHSV